MKSFCRILIISQDTAKKAVFRIGQNGIRGKKTKLIKQRINGTQTQDGQQALWPAVRFFALISVPNLHNFLDTTDIFCYITALMSEH